MRIKTFLLSTSIIIIISLGLFIFWYNSKTMFDEPDIKLEVKYLDEYSVSYDNPDETKTLAIYSAPIAYYDSKWTLTPIDTRIKNVEDSALKDEGYIYTIMNNDIETFYPKDLSKETGIRIKKDFAYEIGVNSDQLIHSRCVENKNFINEMKSMVLYEYSDKNLDFKFYPSSIGSNCEIDFNNKPEENTLNFWLKLNFDDIEPQKQDGGYINIVRKTVVNGEINEEILGIIQVPLIRDSYGNISCKNNIFVRPHKNGNYELVFSFDSKFLDKGSTEFISFEVRREKQPDIAIYSKKPDVADVYLSNYTLIGNSQYLGIGQGLIRFRFPTMLNSQLDKIKEIEYYVYSLTNNNNDFELLLT